MFVIKLRNSLGDKNRDSRDRGSGKRVANLLINEMKEKVLGVFVLDEKYFKEGRRVMFDDLVPKDILSFQHYEL